MRIASALNLKQKFRKLSKLAHSVHTLYLNYQTSGNCLSHEEQRNKSERIRKVTWVAGGGEGMVVGREAEGEEWKEGGSE